MLKYFFCKIKHDKGILYLRTTASSREQVIKQIASFEHCPESAIRVRSVTSELFYNSKDISGVF